MSTWTPAGKAELDRYFARLTPALQATGADPAEVIDDLRQHLDREIAAEQLPVVTEADVRRLLARIGAPNPDEPAGDPTAPTPTDPPQVKPAPAATKPGLLLLVGGVLLPTLTLVVELVTGMCGATFFDPLPTIWHILLAAFVPIANASAWWHLHRPSPQRARRITQLNGIAAGIALFYTLLFIPLLLPGLFAVVFAGLGVLPWTPLLSLVSTVVLRRHLARLTNALPASASLPRLWPALLAGFLLTLLFHARLGATRVGLDLATSDDPAAARRGVTLLRVAGDREFLLRACYGWSRRAADMDVLALLLTNGRTPSAEQARTVYYRVTGTPFNSAPPPRIRTARGSFLELERWTWDEDQGGEQVGGRLDGLTLRSSRLDAVADAHAATGYTEWVLEFQNDAPAAQEARTQILLPPGGVVSRLTLWVNGEEREAAFAGRSQVRQAYQQVAIRQRRDPVLVTTAGPDRILVQCFPVPPNGGTMRIRLGITSPLLLPDPTEAVFLWPRFLERNFSLSPALRHTAWLEARDSEVRHAGNLSASGPTARGDLTDRDLADAQGAVRIQRNPAITECWTPDTRSATPRIIRQLLVPTPSTPLQHLVLVIDGSASLAPHRDALAEALSRLPASLRLDLLIAGDDVIRPGSDAAGMSAILRRFRFEGGRDNASALTAAWDLASRAPGSAVVWIHGPQPVLLGDLAGLRQRCERRADGPPLLCFAVASGSNRILEGLDGIPSLRLLPRLGPLSQDLANLIPHLASTRPLLQLERQPEPVADLPDAPHRRQASLQIARLWARDEITRLMKHRQSGLALDLAGTYQLVTPWSGAVVLETREQFLAAGLEPVDAATVPSIPEPSTLALLVLGALLLGFLRRGNARRAPSPLPGQR